MEAAHKTHRPHIKVGKDEEKNNNKKNRYWLNVGEMGECVGLM